MEREPTPVNMAKGAIPVDPRATWDHLDTLPPLEKAILHDVIGHMRATAAGKPARASVLFSGVGTPLKQTAAEVLAGDLERPLYRVDLSAIVSKYLGETVKNLARLFDAAAEGGAVLFFDEADALFGRRTEVKDSHDRFANLEISFLLQRLEEYDGLVIVSTTSRDTIDDAFLPGLRFVVNFPVPAPGERTMAWQNAAPGRTTPAGASQGPQYLTPGVYVEEVSEPGKGRILGVETGIAAFLGTAGQGPLGEPQAVLSREEFQRIYGISSPAGSWLVPAVLGYFENGGKKCIVLRVDDRGTDEAFISGLDVLRSVELDILSAPGIVSDRVQQALLNHCAEAQDRICVLDPPEGMTVPEVLSRRARLSSSGGFGALYYPWIMAEGKGIPPSGHIAGVYARTTVHKVPEGTGAVLSGITGVERAITDAERGMLDARGVNIIWTMPGSSSVAVWGSRTLSDDPEWKYVHVRRLVIFLKQSIEQGTQWAVFEPNDETTWATVRKSVAGFLTEIWRTGALQGTRADEAFFVKCDRTTMTTDDIRAGRMVCEIGVALLRPSEFTVLRIQQLSPAPE